MPSSRILSLMLALAAFGAPVAAQNPLSAIDWLENQAPQLRDISKHPETADRPAEPPVTRNAIRPEVTVLPLDAATVDAVGLLPPHVTGIPQSLWQASDAEILSDLIIAQNVDGQPAMQSLLFALLLAEALPPANSNDRFLLARIDRLVSLGAVAQATEMLALIDATKARDLYSKTLELSLLSGPANTACAALIDKPQLAPDFASRVYCLAQQGRWDLAYTTLETGRALGEVPSERYNLLLAFLDPELAEDMGAVPNAGHVTPLDYRLYEAIGAPVPTHVLPRAFATADLAGDSGWKAQIEAAERLVRAGALSEQRLFAIYAMGRPSASGGVWDRVDSVQKFDKALGIGDARQIGNALRRVWVLMREAGLAHAFAKGFARPLADVPLTGSAASFGLEMALLSPEYEKLPKGREGVGLIQKFAIALANGRPDDAVAPSARARAISKGFVSDPPATLRALLDQGKLGETILRAMSLAYQGHLGDATALTDALATLRAVGLEDTARRAALQVLLLDQAG